MDTLTIEGRHLFDQVYDQFDNYQVDEGMLNLKLQALAPRAVRARRDILALYIDAIATRVNKPRILAIACGHLREAQKSVAVREGCIGQFVALDQDRASLALVEREQEANGVRAEHGSVKTILKGETILEDFDFVYSTGLYDYLPQPVAIDLSAKLFGMINPGGQLLVANFLHDVPNVGYMESFMGWPLIYRSDEELAGVTQGIPATRIAAQRTYHDRFENVVFLEVEKR